MRRWTVKALTSAAIAAALWSAVIFLPKEWTMAPAASINALGVPSVTVPDKVRFGRATTPLKGELRREFECLALNIYWEAKSEPVLGQVAVAAVTLNRVAHPAFPKTICGVVKQGDRHACQFSWVCDRRADRPRQDEAWQQARDIAYQSMFFDPPDPTGGALYFHANYVRPGWARSMVKVARIGKHIYYRERMTAENGARRGPS